MSGLRWTEADFAKWRGEQRPALAAVAEAARRDFELTRTLVTLTLPYPPSGNRQSRTGKGVHYTPPDVQRFRQDVAGIVLACGVRNALEGRLEGSMVLHPRRPIRWKPGSELPRALDLDNAWKTTADAMQAAGVFLNDRQFRRVVLEYGEPVPGGCVVVTIRRMR